MQITSPTLIALAMGLLGLVAGYVLRQIIAQQKRNSIELRIKQILLDAKSEAQKTLDEAKQKAESALESVKREEKERETSLRKLEERIGQKEELIEKRKNEIERETKEIVKQK